MGTGSVALLATGPAFDERLERSVPGQAIRRTPVPLAIRVGEMHEAIRPNPYPGARRRHLGRLRLEVVLDPRGQVEARRADGNLDLAEGSQESTGETHNPWTDQAFLPHRTTFGQLTVSLVTSPITEMSKSILVGSAAQ